MEGQIAATTTLRPPVRHDVRNFYNTFTTPNGSFDETEYAYSISSEEYFETERTPVKINLNTQPTSVNSDEFYLNANDVAQSTTPNKVGQYEKYPSTTTRMTTSPARTSPASSKSTSKATTTTTTQPITKSPTKLPLLRYFHTQNYTDSN